MKEMVKKLHQTGFDLSSGGEAEWFLWKGARRQDASIGTASISI